MMDRETLELEIRIGNIIMKELDKIKQKYELRATKWHAKQAEKVVELDYDDVEDARNDWGYGIITKREFEEVRKALENNEKTQSGKCDADHVAQAIGHMIANEYRAVKSAEAELL